MVPDTEEGGGDSSTDLQTPSQSVPQETPLFTPGEVGAAGTGEQEQGPTEPSAAQGTQAGMSEAMLEEYDYGRPKRGEIRKGVVVSVQPTEIVVDIGAKRECIIASSDYQKLGPEAVAQLKKGDEVSVYIVKPEDREGHLVGSLHLAHMEEDWTRAEEFEKSGQVFEAKVSGQNRGGLLVPFGRLRGFVPASHLIGTNAEAAERPAVLSHWIGKTLPFKVIEVNRRRNRLILSYRAARRQWRSQQKQSLLEELREGDVRRGIVSSLASFGAFVDLGGADGLIHVSEMAWYRVEHPSEIVQVGQEVEVHVLRVEGDRGRIGLSLKRLQPDPWTLVESKYVPGQTVEAKITKLADFGAFAELERGIEGLIHLSELASPTPARPDDVVQPGQVRLVRVLRVDAQNRRVGLSLKAVDLLEVEAWEARRAAAAAAVPPEVEELAAPEAPEAEEPAATEAPEAEEPAAPEPPEAEEPAAAEAPEAEELAATEAPEAEEPAATEAPEAEEPAAPEAPEAEEPAATEAPEAEELAAPEAPEAEELAAPEAPEAEEPAAPEAPEAEEPAAPEALEPPGPEMEEPPPEAGDEAPPELLAGGDEG